MGSRQAAPRGPGGPGLTIRSYVAPVAFVVSALGLVVGLVALYSAEGPNSPDITSYLASPSGRSEFFLVPFSLTAAILLLTVGMLSLTFELREREPYLSTLANGLVVTAASVFTGFLSVQYALVGLAVEGTDPANQSYKLFAVAAHAIADWGGWTGIVLICGSLLAIGVAMIRLRIHRLSGGWAIGTAVVGLALIPIGFGFVFMLPLAVWQLVTAAALFCRNLKRHATV